MTKRKTKPPLILVLTCGLVSLLLFPTTIQATNLGSLPLGSVIQIMGTDTGMCNDPKCATATSPVLPYRFVKMQAHRINTSGNDTLVGSQGNCNSGNCNGYSYWMLMDNYCWWGSADCRLGYNVSNDGLTWVAGDKGVYQAFNGNCPSHDGTACLTAVTNFNNNITDTKSNNILIKLANFYNSLPANIGGKTKANAIATYNWDMIGVSNTSPPVAGWYTTATNTRTWSNTTYTSSGVGFTFTGSNTVASPPVMTSKIGLLGFTEWQGGLAHYSSYPIIPGGNATFNPPTFRLSQPGTGSTFCKARFNAFNCNLNIDGTNGFPAAFRGFNFFSYVDDNGNLIQMNLHSAANPRVHLPWLRTAYVNSAVHVWSVTADSATYSVTMNDVWGARGVSPAIWLASDIEVVGGAGSYDNPFCLSGGYCPAQLSVTSTSGSTAGGVVLSGMANGSTNNQGVTLTAAVCNTDGECVTKSTTINTGSKNDLQGWTLVWAPNELPSGTYSGTVWVNSMGGGSWLTAAQSDQIDLVITPRQYNLTVIKGVPFDLPLGDAPSLGITPGINGGVTVAVNPSTQAVSVAGTLASSATLTFGNVDLSFQVVNFPFNQAASVAF